MESALWGRLRTLRARAGKPGLQFVISPVRLPGAAAVIIRASADVLLLLNPPCFCCAQLLYIVTRAVRVYVSKSFLTYIKNCSAWLSCSACSGCVPYNRKYSLQTLHVGRDGMVPCSSCNFHVQSRGAKLDHSWQVSFICSQPHLAPHRPPQLLHQARAGRQPLKPALLARKGVS